MKSNFSTDNQCFGVSFLRTANALVTAQSRTKANAIFLLKQSSILNQVYSSTFFCIIPNVLIHPTNDFSTFSTIFSWVSVNFIFFKSFKRLHFPNGVNMKTLKDWRSPNLPYLRTQSTSNSTPQISREQN